MPANQLQDEDGHFVDVFRDDHGGRCRWQQQQFWSFFEGADVREGQAGLHRGPALLHRERPRPGAVDQERVRTRGRKGAAAGVGQVQGRWSKSTT